MTPENIMHQAAITTEDFMMKGHEFMRRYYRIDIDHPEYANLMKIYVEGCLSDQGQMLKHIRNQ